jgi:DNA replication and repair protein RecF
MSHVSQLRLTNFRNYESARIDDIGSGLVVLSGPNGAGKTNVLEALSLLSPGRGLRGAKLAEMQRNVKTPHPDPLPGEREGPATCPAEAAKQRRGKREGEGKNTPWAIASVIELPSGTVKIGTGYDPATEKRLVRINGESVRGQNALSEYVSCIWLTPQMDRIFLDSASARRRFLDRLVFTFDPGHSGRVTRYENALSQRSKLLR